MMTLKHIPPDGPERLIPVKSVSFDPDANLVIGHREQEMDVTISTGRVYIMNDLGKTVASYTIPKK